MSLVRKTVNTKGKRRHKMMLDEKLEHAYHPVLKTRRMNEHVNAQRRVA